MASKYTTTQSHIDNAFSIVTLEHSSKARALAAAKTLPGLVRVATPAGNLVQYVDNR